eukprot:m.59685 g.59685  ORF g.59685 m.59685 type:complete len:412 (-) comp13012_c1_seq1:180-1415(-)
MLVSVDLADVILAVDIDTAYFRTNDQGFNVCFNKLPSRPLLNLAAGWKADRRLFITQSARVLVLTVARKSSWDVGAAAGSRRRARPKTSTTFVNIGAGGWINRGVTGKASLQDTGVVAAVARISVAIVTRFAVVHNAVTAKREDAVRAAGVRVGVRVVSSLVTFFFTKRNAVAANVPAHKPYPLRGYSIKQKPCARELLFDNSRWATLVLLDLSAMQAKPLAHRTNANNALCEGKGVVTNHTVSWVTVAGAVVSNFPSELARACDLGIIDFKVVVAATLEQRLGLVTAIAMEFCGDLDGLARFDAGGGKGKDVPACKVRSQHGSLAHGNVCQLVLAVDLKRDKVVDVGIGETHNVGLHAIQDTVVVAVAVVWGKVFHQRHDTVLVQVIGKGVGVKHGDTLSFAMVPFELLG